MPRILARFAPLAMLAGIALSAGTARADISLTLNGGAPVASGGNFVYTYTATLLTGSAISANGQFPAGTGSPNSQNFVTVYDIQGLVGTGTSTFGNVTAQATGVTPTTQTPADSGVTNLTFFYTGAPQDAVSAPITLGTISFTSTVGRTAPMFYSAATQRDTLPGQIANNTSVVLGPAAVPEPGPVALSLVAAAVCGLGYRARNRNASV